MFPRRLVIQDGGRVEIYDTGNHRIFGVAQAQSADQTLIFTSQDGLVRVKDLPKVRNEYPNVITSTLDQLSGLSKR